MASWLQILVGLALLAAGGECVVRGAVGVARRLGVSELLIGLTLLGFGTSTPELLTSLNAALRGATGIALGNVVGSNISNILLIFALVAILRPVAVDPAALRRDGMVMLGATVALILAGAGLGALPGWVGGIFLAALAGYILVAWREERRGGPSADLRSAEAQAAEPGRPHLWLALLAAAAGVGLLAFGAELLVDGAIAAARQAGISETVIGLTIVALGTSLPEFVASLTAALKGRSDIAFGNIVGSNIYNILGILGVTAVIHPIAVPADLLARDWTAMYGATLLLLFHAAFGARVGRLEGAFMLAHYGLYCWLLWPRPG